MINFSARSGRPELSASVIARSKAGFAGKSVIYNLPSRGSSLVKVDVMKSQVVVSSAKASAFLFSCSSSSSSSSSSFSFVTLRVARSSISCRIFYLNASVEHAEERNHLRSACLR